MIEEGGGDEDVQGEYYTLEAARLGDALLALGAYHDGLANRRTNLAIARIAAALTHTKNQPDVVRDQAKAALDLVKLSEASLDEALSCYRSLILRKDQ